VPAEPNTITRRYFEQLAKVEEDDTAKWMRALEQPERADLAVKHLSEASPMWNSMLRDSITPTIINAGFRNNVIPSEATANLNVRMLPGHSIDELIGQFGKIVSDPQVRFKLAPTRAKTRRLPTSRAHCTKPSSASPRRIFPGPSLFLSFPPGDRFLQPSPPQGSGLWLGSLPTHRGR